MSILGQMLETEKLLLIIGNNAYIGPGAKLFGGITIADKIVIGANSVVNKSFYTPNISIAGVPAKVISQERSADIIKVGDKQ
ncbi:hypothetical protein TRIP_E190340 [uncultured Spirochaetota bacterium]|jgi:serine O-acetyltransferase|uniref:Serine acetyltransferase n=1 Tax=uncultured Spirochaetota bacterium TaxID=460511 RepID=A0A652ZUI5_9SPIR|nr:hypothetical protein TRIP_E190340 [uncultured Spirochaetota bacterium]